MALDEIRQVKIEKLEKLRKAGQDPYPAVSARTHTIKEALEGFEELADRKTDLVIVGRVLSIREHGGSVFADLMDGTARIQLYFKKDVLGDKDFDFFMETVDIGDFIEAGGFLFKTKRCEQSLEVKNYKILTKSLMPLPEKWHGLQDVEERYRKRYLDIIFNEDLKNKLIARSMITEHLRQYLLASKFMEVETPILQTLPGGANAKPFKTHLDTLGLDLYLRIAPELYLKRLLVAGFERVFELGRVFRNEGMDREHNPEFTMLECYASYWDYEKMMEFVEDMFLHLVSTPGVGGNSFKYQEKEIKFEKSFKRISFNDLFKQYAGVDYDSTDGKEIAEKAKELGIQINRAMTKGNIGDEIYKKVARPNITDPTFVINHPLEISPLAKKLQDDNEHVARFQLIVGGMEVVNSFSELNDPIDQRERFEEQEKNAERGDQEAQRLDEDFIEALEYGMPPAAGVGIGIDRLVALLTDSHSVREIIGFPLMKPRSSS